MTIDTRNPEETGQAVTSFIHFLWREMTVLFIENTRRSSYGYASVFLFDTNHFPLHIKPRRFCQNKPDKFIVFRDQNSTGILSLFI